jgi:thiol:disulfide interchange protein DsbD
MFRIFVAVLLSWAMLSTVHAAESTAVSSARSTVTLVSESDTVASGETFRVGLRFRLAPGWHIYWSNPGDAGQPPQMTLTLPDGSTAGGFIWPTPIRITEGPVMTYSYIGDVVLPVTVTPGSVTTPYQIDARANWLVCARLCVPEQGNFHLDLTAGKPAPSAEAPLFQATDARVPQPSPFQASVTKSGTLVLKGEGLSSATVEDAWFFPSASGLIDQAQPQKLTLHNGVLALALTPGRAFNAAAGISGTIVLKDRAGSESDLAIDASYGTALPPAESAPFVELLLFALLGGLILNLMPCVFPILVPSGRSCALTR